MKLHRLTLTNYRGITHRDLEFPDHGVVVISGYGFRRLVGRVLGRLGGRDAVRRLGLRRGHVVRVRLRGVHDGSPRRRARLLAAVLRARWMRALTVPIGRPRVSAISR